MKFVLVCIVVLNANWAYAIRFDLNKVSIFYDKERALDSIVAHLLAADIESVCGYRPVASSDITKATGNVIIIGSVDAAIMRGVDVKDIKGGWERYAYRIIRKPRPGINHALYICGSDLRGTAYGVFDLSARLGVSPWYWWADVPPVKKQTLTIDIDNYNSASPSVKYRGIFINDEDWGLQPWAAKTFEPATGDIGPKTYAKVFELLLRLKANLIWPAMHPSTKAFFHYPGNVKMAADYQVIIGSSHAEPMLRNNVGEWNAKTMGPFNYLTNKDTIVKYWATRVKEGRGINAMYTIGMRGVHDSGLEGVKDPKEAARLLERIFADQRSMLPKNVPQVFTVYKEVLDIYDNDLKLPDDVTLVWPDDNYGYIQRLNNDKEKARPGGSGVYYHASYWGRPHDYLWLGTTHPSLIREEMMKAYRTGADRLWVLNVGDIKPLEYSIQLFMDMAWDTAIGDQHLHQWVQSAFGPLHTKPVYQLLKNYYNLAFERRPEFMGWSQTEPTTKTQLTAYDHFNYGDEATRRMEAYTSLEQEAKRLRKVIKTDAFYQLVYYPVVCASYMNKKFLYRDKAYYYGRQNRIIAHHYAQLSKAMYDNIKKETAYFNEELSHGKWKGIMSMAPRELPVFKAPEPVVPSMVKGEGWDLVPEGNDATKQLPKFTAGLQQHFFIDIFLTDSIELDWKANPSAPWIRISKNKGNLSPNGSLSSNRITVTITGTKDTAGSITFTANGKRLNIGVRVQQPAVRYKGHVEENGLVSIPASRYQHIKGSWQTDLLLENILQYKKDSARVSYTFYSLTNAAPQCLVYTWPTHPLNKEHGMRYGISIDNGPVQIVDCKTVGRSEEWKQNVLRNAAIKKISLPHLKPGLHTLTIHVIDPGLVLDRILINFGNKTLPYSSLKK